MMSFQFRLILIICVLIITSFTTALADWGWISLESFQGEIAGGFVFDQTLVIALNYIESDNDICGVFKSTDRGENWIQVHTFMNSQAQAIDGGSSSLYLALLENSARDSQGKVYRSIDLGDSWTACSGFAELFTPFCIELCSNGEIWVGGTKQSVFTSHLYSSADLGDTWTELTGNFNSMELVLALHEIEPGHVLLGGTEGLPDGGVYETMDYGASWLQNTFSAGLSVPMIESFTSIPGNRFFACALDRDDILFRNSTESEWASLGPLNDVESVNSVFRSSEGYLYAGVRLDDNNESPVRESRDTGDTWNEMYFDSTNLTEISLFMESTDGYIYAMGRNRLLRSAEPVIPPTPTPTTGPGTPTNTPLPPTHTPTPRPPTNTPTPAPPEPTSTPTPSCENLGLELIRPSDLFSPGDEFYLNIKICNSLNHNLTSVPVFVFLDINDTYWFAPQWAQTLDFLVLNLPLGLTEQSIFDPFEWPNNAGSFDGARFWGAMTNPAMTDILGEYDIWEFGWQN